MNFKKLKGGTSAKAVIRHCATDEREKRVHSNGDIDKNLTCQNVTYLDDYSGTCKRYDERLKEVEKTNKNKRKDRVTCFGLETAVPDGITDPVACKEWGTRVMQIISNMYGAENVVGGFMHFDEVHDYRDAENGSKRTSRVHLHTFVIPERDGQLNGKWFSSRANMVKMNRAVETMTREQYGVPYMTGSGKKSTKSVEKLKVESAEQEAKALIRNAKLQSKVIEQASEAHRRTILSEAENYKAECEKALKTANTMLGSIDELHQRAWNKCMQIENEVEHESPNRIAERLMRETRLNSGRTIYDAYKAELEKERADARSNRKDIREISESASRARQAISRLGDIEAEQKRKNSDELGLGY